MLDSLRARLLVWHTSILALTIAVFGGAVTYLFWHSLLADLDQLLRLRAERIASALQPAPLGTFDLELPPEFAQEFQEESGSARYYAIWNAEGGLVDRSNPDLALVPLDAPEARTRDGVREVAIAGPGGAIVVVGQATGDLRGAVWSLAGTIASVGIVVLALAVVGGWTLAGRALAPIARISGTARAMTEGDLSARIATDATESELEQVAMALNSAFDRLRDAVEQQRRFTADASHELRTPLSILAAEVEWARSRPRSLEEYQESLETCHRAAVRMRGVVEGLLTLARADAGEVAAAAELVSLPQVVQEVADLMGPLAAQRDVSVNATNGGGDLQVRGNPDRLREVVTNLVSNAINYNRPGGRVDISVTREDGMACLQVEDNGIGIAPADIDRVFERFFRADPARARAVGGSGLGLAVTKWIVESHHGDIACSSEPGRGTRFVVRLPAAGDAA